MSVLPRLLVALTMLACVTSAALADGPGGPRLIVLQTVAYPSGGSDYTIKLGGWSSFAAASPQPYNLAPTLRLADDTQINLCDNNSTDPCFQAQNKDDILTITLKQVWTSGDTPVLMFHAAKPGGPDLAVPLKLIFSRYGPATPRIVAAIITVLLLGFVAAITSLGDTVRLASGNKISQLRALFINKATTSYSLSKLQLYVWMTAAITTYLYLLAAKTLVQGDWNFIDVPQSVVAVALISVSTSVLSSGVTSVNGGPGSGKFGPSGADLISSGGDVAPERVQQLLWTLMGAPIFIILAYRTDPATINSVQEVPNYFLQLMGVSSAGYVGGMIARGPGPKIISVAAGMVAGPPPFLTLSVRGSDIQTRGATFTLRDLKVPNASDIPLPAVALPTSTIDSSGVATALDLSVPAAGLRRPDVGMPWGYCFTILAPDGERAEWNF